MSVPTKYLAFSIAGLSAVFLTLSQFTAPAANPADKPEPECSGIVLDDDAGQFTGTWVASSKQPPYVGNTYRHDDCDQSRKSARFTPRIINAGEYEVRLIYTPHPNRSSHTPVTIVHADGQQTVSVNQREEMLVRNVPRALGTFRFAADTTGCVTISNEGADGYVVVDAVQFVPVEIAKAERNGTRDSGFRPRPIIRNPPRANASPDRFAALRAQTAAAAAFSPLGRTSTPPADTTTGSERPTTAITDRELVQLAKDVPAAEVDGRHFDLIVVGGTGGGVACAVRAAREGCSVLLVHHNRHIGGMMSNGLMQWDALYGGHRAPLFSELLKNIEQHYIRTSGENSRNHQIIRYTHEHYPIGWAEPHIAEREFNRLVAGEKNVTLLLSHYPVRLEREGATLRSVTLRDYSSAAQIQVRGAMFADATYEGDLLALADVPFRVGREARDEYDEPHAGKVFCNIAKGPAPRDAVEGRLNIRPYSSKQGTIDPTSPYTADGAVQAYNYRFCVTKDPANRIMLTEPPPNYNRDEYVHYNRKGIATNAGPNQKSHMNSPILPGENHVYPAADWPAREKIIERHLHFALGLIWFLQNDESVSASKRAAFRQWGLPKDEFADHNHIPYEMYVREARRIVGRHVYTEHDNSLAAGIGRTPIHPDSVAITDWYMDSHACTTESCPGYHYDGKLILTEESRPGQIPYRSLLPQGVDNLLVPVCLSATHIAWGAVRLEPVWIQTGEAAGFAAALAKKHSTTPAGLDPELLSRTLVEHCQVVSFFNDVNAAGPQAWIPAVEYFGTRGFFPTYDAFPNDPLTKPVGRLWAKMFAQLVAGKLDPMAAARALYALPDTASEPVTVSDFAEHLKSELTQPDQPSENVDRAAEGLNLKLDDPLTRAAACEWMYRVRSGV